MRYFSFFLALPVLFVLALPACSPVVRTNGNMVSDDSLSQVVQGVSRREDVAALLGTPSAESTFNANEWYYIGQRTEQTAFFAPEVTDRKVVRITFDGATGTVANVELLNKEAGQDIALVTRKTPTAGHNLTVMEQVLGNVGRFTPPSQDD